MEFRKMVMITLYARQQKRHRCIEQTFGLCGRGREWDDLGKWHSIYKFGTDSKNTGIAGDMVSTYFLYRCIITACTKIKYYFLKVFKNSLRL